MNIDGYQEPVQVVKKDPWLAVLLTEVFPGAGHVYGGARRRGLIIAIFFIALYILAVLGLIAFLTADTTDATRFYIFALLALTIITLVAGIIVYFDAYKITKRLHPEPPRTVTIIGERKAWLAAFLSAIFPGIGQFYNRQIMKGLGLLVLVFAAAVLQKLFAPLFIGSFLVSALAVKDAYDSAEKINGSNGRFFSHNMAIVLFVLIMIGLKSLPISNVVKSNFVEAFKVPAGSMYPTLKMGDCFLIGKSRPFYRSPRRGDIVVFPYPANPTKHFVKRVIGVGGDKIQIINGELYINEKVIPSKRLDIREAVEGLPWNASGAPAIYEERIDNAAYHVQYMRDKSATNAGPWLVPQDSVFVMGDNRDNSQDSRVWGMVPSNTVQGKALKIYWSWDRMASKVRWERVGEVLH